MRRPTLLVRHGTVLTMDPDRRVLDPGYVAVDGTDVVAVGPDAECPWDDADEVLDATGHAVLPGFVDAHVHSLDILLRGGVSDDRRLYDWLVNVNLPAARAYRHADHVVAVKLFALEALRSGITTVVDQIETPFAEWDAIADVVVDTDTEVGLRAVVAQMFYDTEPPAMAELMRAYGDRHPELQQDLGAQPGRLAEMLDRIDGMIRRHHGRAGGRISFWPAPGVAVLCTREALLGAQRLARAHGVMTTVHVAESPTDRQQQGMSSVQYLAAIGYLRGAHMAPRQSTASAIVYQADGSEVRTVVVYGRVLLRDRIGTWLPPEAEQALLADVRAASARILAEARLPARSDSLWTSARPV